MEIKGNLVENPVVKIGGNYVTARTDLMGCTQIEDFEPRKVDVSPEEKLKRLLRALFPPGQK